MIGMFSNDNLAANTKLRTVGQKLFFQKMVEMLNKDTIIANCYRIHNAYTIICELKSVLHDYFNEKINSIAVKEVYEEALMLLKKDILFGKIDMAFKRSLDGIFRIEIRHDERAQKFDDTTEKGLQELYFAIHSIMTTQCQPTIYLKHSLNYLKIAIDAEERFEILELCKYVVSNLLYLGRTSHGLYDNIKHHFYNNAIDEFDVSWAKWCAICLNYNAGYICLVEAPSERILADNEVWYSGNVLKQSILANYSSTELIEDSKIYCKISFKAPATDTGFVAKAAWEQYLVNASIPAYSGLLNGEHPSKIIICPEFNKVVFTIEVSTLVYEYKPYKQYRTSIEDRLKGLYKNLKENSTEDFNKVVRAVSCTYILQSDTLEYNYLLMWSAVESLFQSKQFPSTIGSIKNIVPRILSDKYVVYTLYNFLRDCHDCNQAVEYNGAVVNCDYPKQRDIEILYNLMRDDTANAPFLQLCDSRYHLLHERATELKRILRKPKEILEKMKENSKILSFNLQRMYRVRNKFVHHSEVDTTMITLYKHLHSYLWECIRDIANISKANTRYSLEEIFAYYKLNNSLIEQKLKQASGNSIDFSTLSRGITV